MKVHVVGGGVIGLCTAYYLNNMGCEVHVIDPSDLTDGTSHGNAGMIVPSHFIPLAAPGVIAKGLKWMFQSSSPFYIKPKIDLQLAQWLWRFYKSCNSQHVNNAAPVLYETNRLSAKLYEDIAQKENLDFGLEKKGLLMMYQTQKMEAEEVEMAEEAHSFGIEAKVLSAAELKAMENGVSINARGAIYFPEDSHLHPNQFIAQMIELLKKRGVVFHQHQVNEFEHGNGKISSIVTSTGERLKINEVVLATGSWTAHLLRKLNRKMLLQNGKGYSFTFKNPADKPSIPAILSEAKVAVTPMGEHLRVGGTLEVCEHDDHFHEGRMKGIRDSMSQYYPDFPAGDNRSEWEKGGRWLGYRPCTPDGLPYVGRVAGFSNLVVSAGHGMMGMSMGPATGLLTSQIVTNQSQEIKTELFNPNRFL